MIKLKLKNRHTTKELREELQKTKDEKYKTKLKAIIKLKGNEHKTREEIATELMVSRQSLVEWIKIYNKKGKQGLKTNKGGRPKGRTRWDDSIFMKLAKEINRADSYWSVRLMAEWLKENENINIPVTTIWYRITQLGYSNKSSRPYPYKGDKKKQKEFKKRASKLQYRVLSNRTISK